MQEVIVVHGLWVPGLAMSPLAARLAAQGFRCHLFRYAGRNHPMEANAERLLRFAHALGAAGKVVLLGTPAAGSFSGRRFAGHRFGRWLLGRSESLWRERGAARWRR